METASLHGYIGDIVQKQHLKLITVLCARKNVTFIVGMRTRRIATSRGVLNI